MAKLTEEKIKAIQEAYLRIGTYSGVAKELGCSAVTVRKYTSEMNKPLETTIVPFEGEIIPVEMIDFNFPLHEWTHLTDEEIREVKKLQEEM